GVLVRHLDVSVPGVRDAQVLGLPAADAAVQLRVPEQGGTGAMRSNLGDLALRLQPAIAHVAVPARDLGGHHHPVPGRQVGDRRTDLLDDAHRLMAQDVALVHERTQHLVQVSIRPTDVGAGDLDDRVGGSLDAGVRDVLDADITLAVPGDRLHGGSSRGVSVRGRTVRTVAPAPTGCIRWRGRPGRLSDEQRDVLFGRRVGAVMAGHRGLHRLAYRPPQDHPAGGDRDDVADPGGVLRSGTEQLLVQRLLTGEDTGPAAQHRAPRGQDVGLRSRAGVRVAYPG